MRILHILPGGGMGWSGGIRPTLRHLAASSQLSGHSFALAGLDELGRAIAEARPDLLAWHVACSWRTLPPLLRRGSIPVLLFEHHYSRGFERHNVPSTARFRTMLRLSYGRASRVVVVSRGQRRWMEEARLAGGSRLRLLRSSRPLDAFLALPFPPPRRGNDTPLRLLAYGRLTAQKGFDRLIRALRSRPRASLRLEVVGDGPERQELERLALGDRRITISGPSDAIAARLEHCDAVVIPSRWEPWGNVCLEARAAGRPVLVSGVDGLPEQVRDCGLVSAPAIEDQKAESALAAGLDELLQTPADRWGRWSAAGRASAGGAWTAYLEGWRRLLEEFPCRN
jgi:glycosyltransferase involved in cell wall biosynthesis